jgi:hypothetical protein
MWNMKSPGGPRDRNQFDRAYALLAFAVKFPTLFVGLSVGLSVELSVGLSIELSVGLSVELSIGLNVCT